MDYTVSHFAQVVGRVGNLPQDDIPPYKRAAIVEIGSKK